MKGKGTRTGQASIAPRPFFFRGNGEPSLPLPEALGAVGRTMTAAAAVLLLRAAACCCSSMLRPVGRAGARQAGGRAGSQARPRRSITTQGSARSDVEGSRRSTLLLAPGPTLQRRSAPARGRPAGPRQRARPLQSWRARLRFWEGRGPLGWHPADPVAMRGATSGGGGGGSWRAHPPDPPAGPAQSAERGGLRGRGADTSHNL